MLFIVLILVLIALGSLVTALVTANSIWAWLSIGLSVLAGVILIVDWLRRRKRGAGDADGAEDAAVTEDGAEAKPERAEDEPESEQTTLIPAKGDLDSSESSDAEDGSARAQESGDPIEEQTDAADLLVVSELDVSVVVVDEFPRYHLTDCAWLAERDTIPIAVSEARSLGFTPCARCGPDATLAAKHRAKRKSRAE